MPRVLPFGCQSVWWVHGLWWQCWCALVLSQPSMAGGGSSGQLLCSDEGRLRQSDWSLELDLT